MTLDKIKALLAESDRTGRPVQVKISDRWVTTRAHEDVTFQLPEESYRVEPPKLREWWVNTQRPNLAPREFEKQHDKADWLRNGWVLTREVLEDSK